MVGPMRPMSDACVGKICRVRCADLPHKRADSVIWPRKCAAFPSFSFLGSPLVGQTMAHIHLGNRA